MDKILIYTEIKLFYQPNFKSNFPFFIFPSLHKLQKSLFKRAKSYYFPLANVTVSIHAQNTPIKHQWLNLTPQRTFINQMGSFPWKLTPISSWTLWFHYFILSFGLCWFKFKCSFPNPKSFPAGFRLDLNCWEIDDEFV